MNTPTILAPGATCSCHPTRVVRYIIPKVPGNAGEVSCRTAGSVKHTEVRYHPLPPRAIVAVFTAPPGVGR